MTGMHDHCRIVGRSLAGERPVDEKTYASVAILAERLERLQHSGGLFAGVEFSPDAEALRQRAAVVTLS